MRGTSCDSARSKPLIATFPSAQALPPQARGLLEQTGSLFDTMAWWTTVQAHAMPAGSEAVFVTVQSAGQTVAVVPALRTRDRLSGFTTPYTCAFAPLIAPGLDQAGRIAAMAAFAGFGRSVGMVHLDCLADDHGSLAALEAGARQAGLMPLRFDHFGNWHEDVSGLDWPAYLRRRPGALRETIRRRLRRAEQQADARFELFVRPEQMDAAAAAFESVYRRSWKDAEPHPTFNAALMRATAALGLLRFGVWSIGPVAVAVQFWTVQAGHAIVLKLAHDEAFKAHSPGTVLTALMLRHLLTTETITEIDFGRGDDAYKRGWATQRRQRVGLLLVNPWRPAGLLALLRHALGSAHRVLDPG